MELIIDTRESKIIPFFEESYTDITIQVKQIQIGDYAIYQNGVLLFIIERKTWQDLAASIRDGRKENINKLLLARDKTGCKILYLMEGKARYAPNKKIGRIPYKNLQSHLDHLIVRDGVYVIHSSSCEDTAVRLIEFMRNYLSLGLSPVGQQLEEKTEGGVEFDLTKKIPKSDLQIIYAIWCCVPGITEKTASLFLQGGYHISDLVLGNISKEEIHTMKYPNGMIIGKRSSKIYRISEQSDENSAVFRSMLTCIGGVTKKTAELLIDGFDFCELVRGSITMEDIAATYKTEKTKIGKKVAGEILRFFTAPLFEK
jgi:ERCC4-type nuclease